MYPRGNNGGAHSPWLALYLVCVDLEAGRGPPRPARFTLQVVNQVRERGGGGGVVG